MDATRTKLTPEEIALVRENFKVYRNTGSVETGKWVYQPHDFDGAFELWSEGYKTRWEAEAAALKELRGPICGPVDEDDI